MTLLIRNVILLGAGKRSGERADVFISGDRISAIGNFPSKSADDVIDGRGAYLAPGFIDVDTTADHYLTLMKDPALPEFLHQGVTTIVGGQCGASLAPLIYGNLESIRKWADVAQVNVDWHTMQEFAVALERFRLGVNFASFAGQTTIRRAIVGDEARPLTKNELNVLGETLRAAIKEGACGLSLGLPYLHGRNATSQELKFLADIVRHAGGILAVHMREDNRKGLEEVLDIMEDSGVRVLVNHLLPEMGKGDEYRAMLGRIAELGPDSDFHFGVRFENGRAAPLYLFLPEWAQKGNINTMTMEVKDDWLAKKIVRDMKQENAEEVIVKEAPRNEVFVGKSLAELRGIFGKKDTREALLELMRRTELRAVLWRNNVDLAMLKIALLNHRVLIGSHASGEEIPPSLAFPLYLGQVDEGESAALEKAVEKITSVPAKHFGFEGRGLIEEGYFADLAMFMFGNDLRSGSRIAEMQCVLVNGTVAIRDREVLSLKNPNEGRSGRVIRRAG